MAAKNSKGYFAGTAFTLISLFSGIPAPLIIKYIAAYMDFWTQNFLRYLTVAIMMLPFVLLSKRKNAFKKDLWRKTLIIGVINVLLQSAWGAAFYYINPALITLLSKTSVLWTVSIAIIFFTDERPLARSPAFWLSFCIVIVGLVGITVSKENFSSSSSITGIILTLIFAFIWAIYTIAVKILLKNEDSTVSFTLVSIYTTIGLGICAFCWGKPLQCANFTFKLWFLIVLSSITGIFISHTTFYSAIKRIGSSIPTLVLLVQPFLVLIVSRSMFSEHLKSAQWFFGILLIAGAALAIKAEEHLKISD